MPLYLLDELIKFIKDYKNYKIFTCFPIVYRLKIVKTDEKHYVDYM